MSETTSSPQDHGEEEGTFVGGEFGHSDNAEDGLLGTAQQEGAEGAGTEPAPGDRNEPV